MLERRRSGARFVVGLDSLSMATGLSASLENA
jgi:hypothetical protein